MSAHPRTRRIVVLTTVLAVAATVTVSLVVPRYDAVTVGTAMFFGSLALLAQALGYRLTKVALGNVSFIPLLGGVAAAPGPAIIYATLVSYIVGELVNRREAVRAVFNVAQCTLAVALAVSVYVMLGGDAIGPTTGWFFGPFAAATAAYLLTNRIAVTGVIAANEGVPFSEAWSRHRRGAFAYDALAIPVVYGFAYIYAKGGTVGALAVALPLYGLRQLYKTNYDLETINEELLQLMVAAIEARDPYTSGHSQRVADYSRVVSRAAGLHAREIERVYTAALLHDVGKIHEEFAPILRKPGRLTDDEYAIMKSHSEKGAALVAKVTQFKDIIPAIRGHHEAWSGRGYPDGLSGDEIPLWARIIAFADTIDAMTTDRPYRASLSPDAVREEVRVESGVQFDPRIANALLSDIHWHEMTRAIQTHAAARRPTPLSVDTVPRHSAPRKTVIA